MRMVKIIGANDQWVNLDAVVEASYTITDHKPSLGLNVGSNVNVSPITDPDQIQRIATILGLEDFPSLAPATGSSKTP